MKLRNRRTNLLLMLAAGAISTAIAVSAGGQVKTETSTTTGQPTKTVEVERGEVVSVNGNDLFVKMENGEIRHFPNIPESARITVDGKQLGIHDLKPGMKLQRTISTTTTPKTVTTVESVTGTVWAVMPPSSVTLRLENGEVQRFNIPKGQKFTIDGKETDAFGLRKGMKVSATRITEAPEVEIAKERKVTGTMETPPSPPPTGEPVLIAQGPPKAAAPAQEVPAKLPKTGSPIPLLGLLGLLSVGASFGVRILRKA
jgi:LPXTG-motif cell wall-anchored protein